MAIANIAQGNEALARNPFRDRCQQRSHLYHAALIYQDPY